MPKLRVRRHEVTQPLDKPYRFIPLTQGQNAIVDVGDFEHLVQWNWFAQWSKQAKTFYAYRAEHGKIAIMHREILKVTSDKEVDHKNRNGLDNRKENLRPCTHAQNMRNTRIPRHNTSGYVGVFWLPKRKRWQAQIYVDGRRITLGMHKTKKAAAEAYAKAATKHHGSFSRQAVANSATKLPIADPAAA